VAAQEIYTRDQTVGGACQVPRVPVMPVMIGFAEMLDRVTNLLGGLPQCLLQEYRGNRPDALLRFGNRFDRARCVRMEALQRRHHEPV
jgi:hypothetical protein